MFLSSSASKYVLRHNRQRIGGKTMITTDDLNVIEGYVARDHSDLLFLYQNMPTKGLTVWDDIEQSIEIPQEMFPNLKWEDEPIKVELTIKRI